MGGGDVSLFYWCSTYVNVCDTVKYDYTVYKFSTGEANDADDGEHDGYHDLRQDADKLENALVLGIGERFGRVVVRVVRQVC